MSLVSLAEQKNLPRHQYMDLETVEWIDANNPFENSNLKSFKIDSWDVEFLTKYRPPLDWFLVPALADSIHGTRHLMRVSLFSILLAKNIKNPSFALKNLVTAAILHDIRREHDKGDVCHGERVARWFIDNVETIANQFRTTYSEKDKEEVYSAMYYHDLDYSKFENEAEYLSHSQIVDFLKTADAVDRYRLPKLKWWFNQQMVRVDVSRDLNIFAYNLVLKSERIYLDNQDSFSAVEKALA